MLTGTLLRTRSFGIDITRRFGEGLDSDQKTPHPRGFFACELGAQPVTA